MNMLLPDEARSECVLFDMGMAVARSMPQTHGNLAKSSSWGRAQSLPVILL